MELKKLINMLMEQRDDYMLSHIMTVGDFKARLPELFSYKIPTVTKKQGRKSYKYINIPCAFDIETSSFYRSTGKIKPRLKKTATDRDDSKAAFMYVWQCMIDGYIIMGRTWFEFKELIRVLKNFFKLNNKYRLVLWVHNLSYEFQFLRRYFKIQDLFATDKRTPIRFQIDGVEFRDSLILSGYALRNLQKDLVHKIDKREGDLNYKLIRHKDTPLTDNEKLYCIYDVLIVSVFKLLLFPMLTFGICLLAHFSLETTLMFVVLSGLLSMLIFIGEGIRDIFDTRKGNQNEKIPCSY